ncbi:MAG TPA: hypothetical protein VJC14_01740 [Candidatus Paceibacterota bacterium]
MDHIQKSLKRLSGKERGQVRIILERLRDDDSLGLDLQKLAGSEDIYRVRKGDLRIIFLRKGKDIFVLAIERRSEKTYRNF